MKKFSQARKELLSICSDALEGRLSIDEFYDRWPNDVEKSDFYTALYEDIEDGVQHFPGKLFSGKPDYKSWHKSFMFKIIYVDKLLLLSDEPEDLLYKAHENALGYEKLSIEEIEAKIRNFFLQVSAT